jgi:hypothetical protein
MEPIEYFMAAFNSKDTIVVFYRRLKNNYPIHDFYLGNTFQHYQHKVKEAPQDVGVSKFISIREISPTHQQK